MRCLKLYAICILLFCVNSCGKRNDSIVGGDTLTYVINGKIHSENIDISNVQISTSSNVLGITDTDGKFVAKKLPGSTCTIVPSKEGISFIPKIIEVILDKNNPNPSIGFMAFVDQTQFVQGKSVRKKMNPKLFSISKTTVDMRLPYPI